MPLFEPEDEKRRRIKEAQRQRAKANGFESALGNEAFELCVALVPVATQGEADIIKKVCQIIEQNDYLH